jgi:hypothetical protein
MAPPSPYDDPVPRGWKLVQGTLRVTVAVQCFGAAAARLHAHLDSTVLQLLGAYEVLPSEHALRGDRLAGYALLLCGVLTLFRPCWPVLLPVTAWFGGLAAGPALLQDDPAGTAALVAGVIAPLVLMLVEFWPPTLSFSIGRAHVSMLLLRLGMVATLIGHALLLLTECRRPAEVGELVRQATEGAFDLRLSDGMVVQVVAVGAAVDLALAANLLAARVRPLVLLLALWGALLAVIPVAAHGAADYHVGLSRAAQAGAPLALFFWWFCAIREQPPIVIPGTT